MKKRRQMKKYYTRDGEIVRDQRIESNIENYSSLLFLIFIIMGILTPILIKFGISVHGTFFGQGQYNSFSQADYCNNIMEGSMTIDKIDNFIAWMKMFYEKDG